jgi:hypothetical protein
MAWKTQQGTKHSQDCNMIFGRKDSDCPRCQELIAGSAPRTWGTVAGYVGGKGMTRKQMDAQRCVEIRNHDCSVSHCGPVCTFGDW